MVELLAHADPLDALLAALWLFAAGMFPVGLMLGSSCSPCCGQVVCCECPGGFMVFWAPSVYGGDADSIYNPDTARIQDNSQIAVSAKAFDGNTAFFFTPSYASCDPQTGLFVIFLNDYLGNFFKAYYRASGGCSGRFSLTPAEPPEGECGEFNCRNNVVSLAAIPESLGDADWIDMSEVTIELECIGCCCDDGVPQAGKSYLQCVQDGGQWQPSTTYNQGQGVFVFLGRCYESGVTYPSQPPLFEDEPRCENPFP